MEQINEEFEENNDSHENIKDKNKDNIYSINDILNESSSDKKMSNINDNFEYIKELKDIQSNENSEKEANLDENAENFKNSHTSSPEKEKKSEKIISIPINIKEQINENEPKNIIEKENLVENENKNKEKITSIPIPAPKKEHNDEDSFLTFKKMRKNINEINNNKINDFKSSLKNKKDLGQKILNNRFGAKEKTKNKFNDTN